MVEVTGVRREGSSLVGRLMPLMTSLLAQPGPATAHMLSALAAALRALPLAFRQHARTLEQAAAAGVMAAGAGDAERAAAGALLALLPRVTGEWHHLRLD